MTRQKKRNYLNERYVQDKLTDLNVKGRSHMQGSSNLLEQKFVMRKLIEMHQRRLDEILATAKADRLLEAIDYQQLKNYMGWFDQVKKFTAKVNLPALDQAVSSAYSQIMSLFGGGGGGARDVLKKLFKDDSTEKKLNDVNHFLWGITTAVSNIPTIIAAIDAQTDGKLTQAFKRETDVVRAGDKFAKMGDEANAKQTATQSAKASAHQSGLDALSALRGEGRIVEAEATEQLTMKLGDTELKKMLSSIGGDRLVKQLSNMIVKSFESAVANFGGKMPFINPQQVANEILNLRLEDVKNLGKAATDLKQQWESERTNMAKTAAAIEKSTQPGVDDSKDVAITDKKGQTSSPVVNLGKAGELDLSDAHMTQLFTDLNRQIKRAAQHMKSGRKLNNRQINGLLQLRRAMSSFNVN